VSDALTPPAWQESMSLFQLTSSQLIYELLSPRFASALPLMVLVMAL
jgi:hypothetical protein